MSARILVVDDIAANVLLLEAKLTQAYYIVLTANNGFDAIEIARAEQPDLILLDVMMPGIDGFETCRRLKADPDLAHIPVVMVTALDQPSDRICGLEAGADDFLTKPPNDEALQARVRSLVRVKTMIDELRLRYDTCRGLGIDATFAKVKDDDLPKRALLIDDRPNAAHNLVDQLENRLGLTCMLATNREEALSIIRSNERDVVILNSGMEDCDGLRLCSEIRSAQNARHTSIILMTDHGDYGTIAASLDLGANDYIMRPIDENELIARVRSQLRRKYYADRLREDVHRSLQLSVTDELTGLYNRHYALPHLRTLLDRSANEGSPLSVVMLDIDRFKGINDTYGHVVGDEVLKQVGERLHESVRGMDLTARFGGEEFLVVMPDTRPDAAAIVAERLRANIAAEPFKVSHDVKFIDLTASLGVATLRPLSDDAASLIERADAALYRSKHEGRNRVSVDGDAVAAA